jgi:hypothetical protein
MSDIPVKYLNAGFYCRSAITPDPDLRGHEIVQERYEQGVERLPDRTPAFLECLSENFL